MVLNLIALFPKQCDMNHWKGDVIIGNTCKVKYILSGVFRSRHTKSLAVYSEEYFFLYNTYCWSVSPIERHSNPGKEQN